jgi:DNA-directed RNA polymerase subunit F
MIEAILTIVNVLFLIIIVAVVIYAYYSIYAVMDDVDSLAKDVYGKTEKIKHKVKQTKIDIVKSNKILNEKIENTKEEIDETHGSFYHHLEKDMKLADQKLSHHIDDLSDTVRKDRNTNIGLIAQVNHRINKQNVNTKQNLEAIDQTFGIVANLFKHQYIKFADVDKAYTNLSNDLTNFTQNIYPQEKSALKNELIQMQQDSLNQIKKDIKLQGGQVNGDLTITGKLTANDISGVGVDKLKTDILNAVPKTDFTNVQQMKVSGNVDIGGNLTGLGVDQFKKDLLASIFDTDVNMNKNLTVSGKLVVNNRDILQELDRLNSRLDGY